MTDVQTRRSVQRLLSGVDALVQLLGVREQVDARDGVRSATLASGYPGSPLGTFDMALDGAGALLETHRIVHRPGLNEELAAATVWGSQMGSIIGPSDVDGVVGAWYGKAPGLDRSGDAMKHGNAMGAGPNGGVVMFCGDDPTAKSSTLTCDSQYTFEDACMPVLFPSSPQEIVDLGVHAFALSRYSGTWVGMKVVTAVADGVGSVDLDVDRHHPSDPEGFEVDGTPWRHEPQRTVGPHAVPDQEVLVTYRRLEAAKAYVRHNGLDRVTGAGPGARLGIVCAGKTYVDVIEAFGRLGVSVDDLDALGVRILKLAMTYPLVEDTVTRFAGSVDRVVVIEEKRPFVESQLRVILHEARSGVPVEGKRDGSGVPLTSAVGELDPTSVAAVLARTLPELADRLPAPRKLLSVIGALPPRPPGYCSGCPHNRSTLVPEGAIVGGGVGCHGIMYFEARNSDLTKLPPTPMGAEGVPWIGLAPFVDEPHVFQNLGDGTLSHSGSLAIRASVAAGANITFKILYNAAVAMTGGQDVTGLLDVPSMTRALEAEGVGRIVVCAEDPKHYGRHARWAPGVKVLGRDDLPEVQEELRTVAGVSVIIYDQRCAAESRRLRKRGELEEPPQRVVINEAVCEGCGDCSVKSNCLSVLPHHTEFGEKRTIDDPSCNRDYTCLDGDCPSFVTVTPRPGKKRRKRRHASGIPAVRPSLPAGTLPAPGRREASDPYRVYFTGIGGTGVVTANRIIAAAAEHGGLTVSGMDQTGLSQKAGAVVSHLQLAADPDASHSPTVADGSADLYLSGDILQAAGDRNLAKVRPGSTIAVVDADMMPTAAMLQTDTVGPDGGGLRDRITEAIGEDHVTFVESRRIAEVAFANPMLANIVLLGAAFQRGAFPMTLEDLDHAIERQGRGAADTREAFEWGRWVVHDPAAVEARVAEGEENLRGPEDIFDPSRSSVEAAGRLVQGRAIPSELEDLLVRRTAQAIDYQNERLAVRFLDLVELAAAGDSLERGWELTRAVAESWFKLLTYKDEYEVARLHLKVNYDRIADDLGIEGGYKVLYHLHPPFLRRMGMQRKLPLGRTYDVGFRVLRRLRRLRGTSFDPFGLDPDRRMERAVADEYEALIRSGVASGAATPYDSLVQLAQSAVEIKGYGPIKEDAVGRWRGHVTELQGDLPSVP